MDKNSQRMFPNFTLFQARKKPKEEPKVVETIAPKKKEVSLKHFFTGAIAGAVSRSAT